MSNYPDDIRQYDNDPRSPFYEEPDSCDKCGMVLEFYANEDGGYDEKPHDCNSDEEE